MVPNLSFAGDNMSAGEVLEEDSYVFSLEEAKELRIRMAELERKEAMLGEQLLLEDLYIRQIDLYRENETLYDEKEDKLREIISLQDERNNKYKRMEKWNRAENIALFTGGIILTTVAFIVVDKISDDSIDDITNYDGVSASEKATIRF